MLDVHILVMDYTNADWLEDCRKSVAVAAAEAGFPVVIHELPGVIGHMGRARAAGYARGAHEYVTHVDDDDFVRPEAFAILRDAMERGEKAITTGEVRRFEPASVEVQTPEATHHLAVYRRDALSILQYDAFRFYPDQYILSRFVPRHIPVCVYVHRVRDDSGSRNLRRAHAIEAQRELDAINNPNLAMVECMTPAEIAAISDQELARAA